MNNFDGNFKDSNLYQIDKLNSSNYETWSVQIRMLLIHTNLWYYVNGTVKKPSFSSPDLVEWLSNDKKALATILLAINPSELSDVKHCIESAHAWETLKEKYSGLNSLRLELVKQLVTIKKDKDRNIQDYINDFSGLIYNLKDKNIVIPDEVTSVILLHSLPEDLTNLITNQQDLFNDFERLKSKIVEVSEKVVEKCEVIEVDLEPRETCQEFPPFDDPVVCGLHNVEGKPSVASLWGTTNLGDIFVFDPLTLQSHQLEDNHYIRDLTYKHKTVPWRHVLTNGFPAGSQLTVICSIPENCDRFSINLECNSDTIALHFNPRFHEKAIVRNCKENGEWGVEERDGPFPLHTQTTLTVNIICQREGFKILLDGSVFTHYEHRMKPELISHATVQGTVHIQKITYKSNKLICSGDAFWRQMGGHMAQVETCSSGVTWGISADNTLWLYSGGWGGSFLSGLEKSESGVYPMKDTYCFHVYENQRWNPLTGFTPKGLPTDRPMWSDSTGLHKRSKESMRLLNMHWQWVSDWSIDFTTQGGVDADGWQYATDFPATYHARKTMTDYVRRRRWSRKCKLNILGPWQEIGNTKIVSVSLQQSSAVDTICVWAVGIGGDALFRKDVTVSNPMGESWEQVACDQTLESISCGYGNQVWAVTRKGFAIWRFGITTSNPVGLNWEVVENPKGTSLKKVSVAKWSVWALDSQGKVFVRHEVSPVFPEGSHWQSVDYEEKFEDISACVDEVWAVSSRGMLFHRTGISKTVPTGLDWDPIINVKWKTVSCRGYLNKN